MSGLYMTVRDKIFLFVSVVHHSALNRRRQLSDMLLPGFHLYDSIAWFSRQESLKDLCWHENHAQDTHLQQYLSILVYTISRICNLWRSCVTETKDKREHSAKPP
jgi:hypothetical protein